MTAAPRRKLSIMTMTDAAAKRVASIMASKGGEDSHPAWYLNLVANPEVEVAYAGAPKRPYAARVASAEERAELWPKVTSSYDNYAGYQRKTDREIPLVLLTPKG